jgi:aerobic carbon-monoxide dehydrogenase small subunit
MKITLTVNGIHRTVEVEPRRTLADVLRDELGLTGTHLGCEHGVCGACTVLVDGAPVRACLMFAVQCDHTSITTIEGLAKADELHPVQQAFVDRLGLQCGFCTPGFVMLVVGALESGVELDDDDAIDELLAANLCRCTGYTTIKEAVRDVIEARSTPAAP